MRIPSIKNWDGNTFVKGQVYVAPSGRVVEITGITEYLSLRYVDNDDALTLSKAAGAKLLRTVQ